MGWLSKTLQRGAGTSVPGYAIERYFPSAVKYLAAPYSEIILVSGTNGKTTTRALINEVYRAKNIAFTSNLGGANIYRGIATAFLNNFTRTGKPKNRVAILEVEEATLPKLTKYLEPTKLVLTNIFRDQLDAYGEIDQTLSYFQTTLAQTNPTLILNQDDPKLVNYLQEFVPQAIGFGLEKNHRPLYEENGAPLVSPASRFNVTEIKTGPRPEAVLTTPDQHSQTFISPLPGAFNLYNFAAAVATTYAKFGPEVISILEQSKRVFGRGETIKAGETTYHLYLVKNPAGFAEVLKYLQSLEFKALNLNLLMNDNVADGRDVSWLWDVPFEDFFAKQKIKNLRTAGNRGLDLLLRVKYAGAEVELDDNLTIPELISTTKDGATQEYLLCTYTALLEVRRELGKHTTVSPLAEAGN